MASPPAGPGPATLFTSGRDALATGAYSTARRAFDDLLLRVWGERQAESADAALTVEQRRSDDGAKIFGAEREEPNDAHAINARA